MNQPFKERHPIGVTVGTVLAVAAAFLFAVGCWNAALAFD
jgi:hypothetical protein